VLLELNMGEAGGRGQDFETNIASSDNRIQVVSEIMSSMKSLSMNVAQLTTIALAKGRGYTPYLLCLHLHSSDALRGGDCFCFLSLCLFFSPHPSLSFSVI
jgi:hypothetical protein